LACARSRSNWSAANTLLTSSPHSTFGRTAVQRRRPWAIFSAVCVQDDAPCTGAYREAMVISSHRIARLAPLCIRVMLRMLLCSLGSRNGGCRVECVHVYIIGCPPNVRPYRQWRPAMTPKVPEATLHTGSRQSALIGPGLWDEYEFGRRPPAGTSLTKGPKRPKIM
jgi:hypothetical protein